MRCTCGSREFAERVDTTSSDVTRWVLIYVLAQAGAGVQPAGYLAGCEDTTRYGEFDATKVHGTRAVFCKRCKRLRRSGAIAGITPLGYNLDSPSIYVIAGDAERPISSYAVEVSNNATGSTTEVSLTYYSGTAPALGDTQPLSTVAVDALPEDAVTATLYLRAILPTGLSGTFTVTVLDRATGTRYVIDEALALST